MAFEGVISGRRAVCVAVCAALLTLSLITPGRAMGADRSASVDEAALTEFALAMPTKGVLRGTAVSKSSGEPVRRYAYDFSTHAVWFCRAGFSYGLMPDGRRVGYGRASGEAANRRMAPIDATHAEMVVRGEAAPWRAALDVVRQGEHLRSFERLPEGGYRAVVRYPNGRRVFDPPDEGSDPQDFELDFDAHGRLVREGRPGSTTASFTYQYVPETTLPVLLDRGDDSIYVLSTWSYDEQGVMGVEEFALPAIAAIADELQKVVPPEQPPRSVPQPRDAPMPSRVPAVEAHSQRLRQTRDWTWGLVGGGAALVVLGVWWKVRRGG